ncbi:MAG TPA: nitronate monooxygenase [Rubrobacteraceae bacterium]|nr:nitronate monooxygenase [Rubrobacteraceae bacterium]
MAIKTALTKAFGLKYPIVLAPMGSVAGGRLAAEVSNSGGLGLVGGGYGDPDWLREELSLARDKARRPWGVGLITWCATQEIVDLALSYEPNAFMLSFGDSSPYASAIKETGCKLICQVQNIEGALAAEAAGADVIVAQGTEAGGHGAEHASTLPLLPAVVDAVDATPVLAAGGIADGRGLAAALMLGAQGVLIGTRFYASIEALGHEQAKEQIVAARGSETKRTQVFDVVRGLEWPEEYTGRALRNDFLERWDGWEKELATASDGEDEAFRKAEQEGNTDISMVWCGEAVDLISDVPAAAELVRRVGAEAEARLQLVSRLVDV